MSSVRSIILYMCLILLSSCAKHVSDNVYVYHNGCSDTTSFVDPRDSIAYNTVIIGNQTWMAENLRWLPKVSPPDKESHISDYYYVYAYEGTDVSEAKTTDSFQNFGVLYNWSAAFAACPDGWRLPSDDDWVELISYITDNYEEINRSNVGNYLKSKNLWSTLTGIDYWTARGSWTRRLFTFKGTDEFCFSALPGGYRSFYNKDFNKISLYGFWWSSSEISLTKSSYWVLSHHSGWLKNNHTFDIPKQGYHSDESEYYKASAYSVRCIRDD